MTAPGTLELVGQELALIFRPLEARFAADNAERMLAELGLSSPAELAAAPPLVAALGQAVSATAALPALIAQLATAIEAGDAAAITSAGVALVERIAGAVQGLTGVAGALDALAAGLAGLTPSQRDELRAFAAAFAERVLGLLLVEHLEHHARPAFAVLLAFGAIEIADIPPGPAGSLAAAYTRKRLHFDRVLHLLRDPLGLLRDVYRWGAADFDGLALFRMLKVLLDSTRGSSAVLLQPPGMPATLEAIAFSATVDPAGPLPGLAVSLRGATDVSATHSFGDPAWTAEVSASAHAGADVDLTLAPPLDLRFEAAAGSADLSLAFNVRRAATAPPVILFGQTGGSRLEARSLSAGISLEGHWGGDGAPVPLMPSLRAGVEGGRLILTGAGADSFLGELLSGLDVEASFDVGVSWSPRAGLQFDGGGGLEIDVPLNVQLGPFSIDGISLGLEPSADGVRLDLAALLGAELGPLGVRVDRMGARALLSFPPGGGNLGPLDLELGFKPPDGLGLSLSTAAVSGGGYIAFDHARQQYSGVLQLSVQNIIDVKAIGILNARLPDGRPGYSLLLIITGEFPPIQLGMGFTLNGLGGLIGINRTVATEVLRAGLRAGSMDSILFPPDPLGNVPALLGTLGSVFPVAEGRHVFGPMAKIGWGVPTILTLDLALILELPEPIRLIILGRLKLVLPDERAPLIKLRMDAMGVLDFARSELSLDATLYDSRVVTFEISGDMALRLSWGARPDFLLSIGGFHPAFKPPPGFPVMRRLSLPLSSGDNPRLRMEAYFAITSNTVQVGARLELYVGIAGFSLEGGLGFDTLIQFSPFRVQADLHAYLALKRGSTTLMGIDIEVHLTGPAPWVLWGRAKFKLFIISFSIPVRVTFGRAEEVPALERQDVWPVLREGLGDAGNWSAQLPPDSSRLVVLRAGDGDGDAEPLAHPLGTLTVSQSRVPLEQTLGLFGAVPPKGHDRFAIESAAGLAIVGKSTQHFAPAQFRRMSDAEKLASPSFERMVSGARLAPQNAVALGHVQETPLDYEQSVILDVGQAAAERLDARYAPAGAAVAALAEHGPAGTAEVRAQGRSKFGPAAPGPAVAEPMFVVVTRADLTPVALEGLDGTYTSAAERMRHRADRAALQIVRAEELELT